MSKYKIASLFSGCGGLDLGFMGGFNFLNRHYEKLPFEIVFSNDIDEEAVNTYKENIHFFNKHDVLHDDVKNVDFNQINDFDILLAGFPCQPFSNAGSRKGVLDDRGTLFEEVIRAVVAKKPKVVLMENVRGILSSKMPDGKKVTDEITDRLKNVTDKDGNSIHYNVLPPKLVKASDFGVPQDRYRVIMIAFRSDISNIQSLENITDFITPFEKSNLLLRNILPKENDLPNINDLWDLSPQALNLASYITRSWKDIPYDVLPQRFRNIRDNMKRYHSPNFYRRFNLEEINGTITASAQPEKCGILHPLENRRYNVREIARIQSFPDNFTFNSASTPGKYKVIGNAVPPVLSHTIAKFVLNSLN